MKGKAKSTVEKNTAEKKTPKIKIPKPNAKLNPERILKDISALVEVNADKLAKAVLQEGLAGQVPQVKYLFEVAHIFPQGDADTPTEHEHSLAETLLDRLNIPKTPVVHDLLEKEADEDATGDEPVKETKDASEKSEGVVAEKDELVTV